MHEVRNIVSRKLFISYTVIHEWKMNIGQQYFKKLSKDFCATFFDVFEIQKNAIGYSNPNSLLNLSFVITLLINVVYGF